MTQDKKPLISIITICYNSQKYIKQTIESVLNQTYDNIEHIIIDGKSTDGTLDIIEEYKSYYIEKKLILLSEIDKGISDAFNKGTNLASGVFIQYLNSGDELISPTVLEEIVEQDLLTISAINCFNTLTIEEDVKKVINAKVELQDIRWKNTICHQSVILDCNIAKRYPFDERLKIEMEYDLWFKMHNNSEKFIHVNKVLSKYLIGGISSIDIIKGAILHFVVLCINDYSQATLKNLIRLLTLCLNYEARKIIKKILGKNTTKIKKILQR